MNKTMLSRVISLMLCAVIMFSCQLISFAENDTTTVPSNDVLDVNASTKVEGTISAIKEVKTELICISKYGNTVSFPANSAEGVLAAAQAGADMVLVRVMKTADGQIVLLSDSDLSNVCVTNDGKPVNKDVTQMNYDELKNYFLRNGSGVSSEKMTAYAVPTLKGVLELVDKRTVLLIEDGWEYRNEIYDILSECNALGYTALLTDAPKSEIVKWQASKASLPLIVTKYKGTVVWNSRSYIRKSASVGAIGVLLENKNAYSTTFSKSTVAKTKGEIRAMIDMTDPKLCGNRQDIPVYWDDVTSRGFSMIITNNIEQFIEYRNRVEQARKNLENLLEKASDVDYELCSVSSANTLKSAVKKADAAVISSVSAMELETLYNSMNNAYNSLQEKSEGDKATATYSSGRILAAVLVTILLVVMELAFEFFRNKSIAMRNNGKKLFFSKSKKKKAKKKKRDINFD